MKTARFYCCGEVCCGKKMCISGKLYVVKARQAPKTLPLRKKHVAWQSAM